MPSAFDKLSPYLRQTVSVCTCIYPQYPQVQGNTLSGRRKRPHWNRTTARVSRGRHPALRRLLTRSAIGLDGCIIMYSAFLRLRRDCGHVVRDLEGYSVVGFSEQLTLWIKTLLLLYCGLFFNLNEKKFKKFQKKFFSFSKMAFFRLLRVV